jgi:DNA processing protein
LTGREEALLTFNAWEGFNARCLEEWAGRGLLPEEVLDAGRPCWEELGLPEKCRDTIERLRERQWGKREAERSSRLNVRLVFWGDDDYPADLADLDRPPAVLYAKGLWPLPSRMDGVVGTRKCSPYGARMAREIASYLAQSGVGVLSGGALGIDGAAHAGAIEAGGLTVAVLGTGVDLFYPAEHERLFHQIQENGLLLSEYPFSTPARTWRFPNRNRLIAALAGRVIVVEAPARSGAINTAKCAMVSGKDVWAVPGRVGEWVCEGSNRLLWDGAHPLVDLDDLACLPLPVQGELFPTKDLPSSPVLEALRAFGDQTVDILASQVKMGAAEILAELSRLEAYGLVRRSLSGRWSTAAGQKARAAGESKG